MRHCTILLIGAALMLLPGSLRRADAQPAPPTPKLTASKPAAPKMAAPKVTRQPATAVPQPTGPVSEPTGPVPQPTGPQAYDLRYKLSAGELLRCEVVHRATVESSIQGTAQTAETRSKSIKAWRVTGTTPDGQITFINSVESIDLWQRMQGRQEVRYNSATDKEIPPGYESAAQAVGVPLTIITMDQRGNILKREQRHPQPDTQAPQIAIPLPAEPVAIGHTWTSPLEIEVMLNGGITKKVRTQQKFSLESVKDGQAKIQVDTQVLTPIQDPAIEAQLIQRLSNGTITFDIEAGRVTSQQLDLDRRVLGFSGPTSTMHYLTRYTEKLLPPAAETATTASPALQ